MARAVELCLRHGTRLVAHPSYPDRAGFGRTSMAISPDVLARSIEAQCAALAAVARLARGGGATVTACKPHGALYHDVDRDPDVAEAFLEGVARALGPVAIVCYPGSSLATRAAARGMAYLGEAFADRGYDERGRLLPRGTPGASIHDPQAAAEQALRLARTADTLCVHGDTDGALAIARAVRAALEGAGLLA
jgi:UPF0271 protein